MGVSRYYMLYVRVYDGRECAGERRHADMMSYTDTEACQIRNNRYQIANVTLDA